MSQALTFEELLDAVVARITALNLTGAPAVGEFEGDDRVLNADAVFPHVAVNVAEAEYGPNTETLFVTVSETSFVEVIVSTANGPTTFGQYRAGLRLLTELRAGLNGWEIARGRYLAIIGQGQDLGLAGVFQWTQRYQLKQLDSRPEPA